MSVIRTYNSQQLVSDKPIEIADLWIKTNLKVTQISVLFLFMVKPTEQIHSVPGFCSMPALNNRIQSKIGDKWCPVNYMFNFHPISR